MPGYKNSPCAGAIFISGLLQSTFLAVDTAGPAARSPHAFMHLVSHDDEVLCPGLRLGTGSSPADPLIAGQGRYIFPRLLHLLIGQDGIPHICRQLMDSAVCE